MSIPFDIIEAKEKTDKWIVFIHGFGGSRKMFKKQIDSFKDFFNLLVLDLPGHGNSEQGLHEITEDKDNGHGIKEVATEILNLLKSLNIDKADFIGVSLGTLIIAQIALMQPTIIDKVVLCGAIFGFIGIQFIVMHLANFLRWILPHQAIVDTIAFILMPKRSHKKSRSFFIKESKKLDRQEFMSWFELLKYNSTLVKDKITELLKLDSLIIMGKEDNVCLPCVKRLVHKYNLKFKVIENCGHVCNLEKPAEFNQTALDYLMSA